ncbi:hypothetical protein CH063_08108 [Colletotrichum higginsianum]|nr:Subtilisin-like protease 2 [Colletotrichum higginsianum]CCF36568.1 hypothetical protein CH063_08108 [Colletotrichum higginsianum]
MLILYYDGLLRRCVDFFPPVTPCTSSRLTLGPYQDGTAEDVSALIKDGEVDDDDDDDDGENDDDAYEKWWAESLESLNRIRKRAVVRQNKAPTALVVISQPPRVDIKELKSYSYDESAGTGVTVYVVDHGYYTRNSEYTRMAVPPRWIFAGSQSQKQVREDLHRHGHGSCVGSKVNGPKYGTAKNVNLVIVKAATVAWETDDALRRVLEDVKRRKLQGKAVISLARGRHDEAASEELKKLTNELIQNDVVIVASSGNDFRDAVERGLVPAREINHWPALMAGQGVPIINVGAVDNTGKNASFSQGGPLVHVMAPGVGVRCASNSFFFRSQRVDGTSFASPAVAGLAAYLLALGKHPELRQTGRVAANMKELLIEMSYRRSTGGGLVVYNGQAAPRSRFRGAKGS